MASDTPKYLTLELYKLPEKCVLLYLTVGKFITWLYSIGINNYNYRYSLFEHCIFTVFPLLIHCSKGVHSDYLKPYLKLNKQPKKRVLLYLIMGKFCNLLELNLFQKSRINHSINNLLLIHYYFHYYSLLFFTMFPNMKLITFLQQTFSFKNNMPLIWYYDPYSLSKYN